MLGLSHPYTSSFVLPAKRPSRVSVVGSYLVRTLTRPVLNVDIAMEIPADTLLNKDYLNGRYLSKRAAYVEAIRSALAAEPSGEFRGAQIGLFLNDPQKPLLILTPRDLPVDYGRFRVRLHPVLAGDVFPTRKLLPGRNCHRGSAVAGESQAKGQNSTGSNSAKPQLQATPLYNQRILEDTQFTNHLRLVHRTVRDCPALAQTVQLLKVWARQRGLFYTPESGGKGRQDTVGDGGGVTGFALSMVVVYLVSVREISKKMSVNQAFRAAIRFLANRDLQRDPALVAADAAGGAAPDPEVATAVRDALSQYAAAFPASLVCPFGVNVFSRVSASAYAFLRSQAQRSVQLLGAGEAEGQDDGSEAESSGSDDEDADGAGLTAAVQVKSGGFGSTKQSLADQNAFRALFLTKIDFYDAFDVHVVVTFRDAPVKPDPVLPTLAPRDAVARRIARLMRRGFGDRVRLLCAWGARRPAPTRKANNTVDVDGKTRFRIGLCVDESKFSKNIEMGPPADSKADAKSFRAFWGARAELRRFKDGRINETVVWEGDRGGDGLDIAQDIAEFLIQRHFETRGVEVVVKQRTFERTVRGLTRRWQRAASGKRTPGRKGNQEDEKLKSAFSKFAAALQSLGGKGVPLDILSVRTTHPALRATDPDPPRVRALSAWTPARFPPLFGQPDERGFDYDEAGPRRGARVVEAIVRFSASGKWPDDTNAVSRIKTAFYIKIGEALEASLSGASSAPAHDFVDVYFNGFAFRVRIFYEKELSHRFAIVAQMPPGAARAAAALPAHAFRRDLVVRPMHHAVIRALAARQPSFAAACRIFKVWLSKHLFSSRGECSLAWLRAAVAAPDDVDPSGSGAADAFGPKAALRPLGRFPEEAAELLVAAAYTDPGATEPPASALRGFLSALVLLGTHDWAEEPLIVDVNGTLSASRCGRALEEFQRRRQGGGGAAMYLITPSDPTSDIWTQQTPSRTLLARVVTYARAAAAHLRACLGSAKPARWKSAFKTPLNGFDIFVTTRSVGGAGPERRDSEDGGEDAVGGSACLHAALPGFDPVDSYVCDLQQQFRGVLDFAYDILQPKLIVASWAPKAMVPRKFSVASSSHAVPLPAAPGYKKPRGKKRTRGGDAKFVIPNVLDIVLTIRKLGAGLVKDVYVGYDAYKIAMG